MVKGSPDPPLVPLLPLLTVVTLPAAKDDGVNEPAIEAFGVILGPPPEFVEGDAWEPGDDESILACMAETFFCCLYFTANFDNENSFNPSESSVSFSLKFDLPVPERVGGKPPPGNVEAALVLAVADFFGAAFGTTELWLLPSLSLLFFLP